MNEAFSNSKVLLHGDRLKQYIDTKLTDSPVTVTIDLTNTCNNKCPKCVTRFKNNDKLDYETIVNLLYDLKFLGVRGIHITGGGEPLLHPRIVDIIELGNKLGFSMGLVTSGQYIYGLDIKRLLENLVWIRISLDAGTPEHYKETHGLEEKEFNHVMDFIKLCCQEKVFSNLPVTIGASYLVALWNKEREEEDIHKAIELLQLDGIDYFQIKQYHGNKVEIDYLDKTKEISNINLYNTFKSRRFDRNYSYCHGAHFTVSIAANGKVFVCCHYKNNELYPIGDITKQSIKDIWNSKLMLDTLKDIDTKQCIKSCKYNTLNVTLENTLEQSKSRHKDFL